MKMNGLELFLLGRKLAKLGMEAIPKSALDEFPPSAQAVLVDVLECPNSSIGEIAKRTELPQSQVSAATMLLEERCLLETVSDPDDRRRTLVRAVPGVGRKIRKKVDVPIDQTIANVLLSDRPEDLDRVLEALELLSTQLTPRALKWSNEDGEDGRLVVPTSHAAITDELVRELRDSDQK
jgi:DNA-binding MarR family transcriptional regulator